MLVSVIKACCPGSQYFLELDIIRRIRNDIAHPGLLLNMSQQDFDSKWAELETAALGLAARISKSYEKRERLNISRLKTTNVEIHMILESDKSDDLVKVYLLITFMHLFFFLICLIPLILETSFCILSRTSHMHGIDEPIPCRLLVFMFKMAKRKRTSFFKHHVKVILYL